MTSQVKRARRLRKWWFVFSYSHLLRFQPIFEISKKKMIFFKLWVWSKTESGRIANEQRITKSSLAQQQEMMKKFMESSDDCIPPYFFENGDFFWKCILDWSFPFLFVFIVLVKQRVIAGNATPRNGFQQRENVLIKVLLNYTDKPLYFSQRYQQHPSPLKNNTVSTVSQNTSFHSGFLWKYPIRKSNDANSEMSIFSKSVFFEKFLLKIIFCIG